MKNILLILIIGVISLYSLLISGCTFLGQPRTRLASYASATPGTNFIDNTNLGKHCYEHFLAENNGIAYTCRGGHIDIAHLRIASDYVRYLYNKTKKNIENQNSSFTFKLNVESSMYYVELEYPENWENIKNENIIHKLSLELAEHFTFTMTTWHEVLTWYGYKCIGLWPEDASAFSWEDIYSNLLGVRLGAKALQQDTYTFNKAMTVLLTEQLNKLDVQPARISKFASEKMRGKWYDGNVAVTISERNLDIGLDDGMVTPTLVPGVCQNAKPKPYPIPTLDLTKRYGLKLSLEIEPREFEKGKILRIIYPDRKGKRIIPEKHFPKIIKQIEKEGLEKGYNLYPPKLVSLKL